MLGLHVVRVTYNMRTGLASKKCTTIRFEDTLDLSHCLLFPEFPRGYGCVAI